MAAGRHWALTSFDNGSARLNGGIKPPIRIEFAHPIGGGLLIIQTSAVRTGGGRKPVSARRYLPHLAANVSDVASLTRVRCNLTTFTAAVIVSAEWLGVFTWCTNVPWCILKTTNFYARIVIGSSGRSIEKGIG